MIAPVFLFSLLGGLGEAFAHGPGHHHGKKTPPLKRAKDVAVLGIDFRNVPQEIAVTLTDESKCEKACRQAVLRQDHHRAANRVWIKVSPQHCTLNLKPEWLSLVFDSMNPMVNIGTVNCRYSIKE